MAPGKPRLKSKIDKKTRTATLTFTDKGATSFSCALVRSSRKQAHSTAPPPHYSSCASPKKYKKLRHGKQTFFVKGSNSAGASQPARKAFSV